MTEFFGKDLVFQWIGTAGTTDMSEYQRGASFAPAGQIENVTTGAAGYEENMVGIKSFTAGYKGLAQAAGTSGGTALEDTLAFGQAGTIIMGPEGTATGKRRYTLPCISQGLQQNFVYNEKVELNCSFVGSGTAVYGAY